MSKKDIATSVAVLFALGNKDEDGKPKIRRMGLGAKLQKSSTADANPPDEDNYLDKGEFVDLSTDDGVTYALLAKVIKTKFSDFDTDVQVQQVQDAIEKHEASVRTLALANGGDIDDGDEISEGDIELL